jgi:WD40 repeat protein
MEHEINTHPFISTKVRPLCYSSNEHTIAVGQDCNQLLLINKTNLSVESLELKVHLDRVTCIRITDKLLARGGTDGILSLWDNR